MSDTPHKALVCRFYAEIWDRHDLSRLGEILQPGFTFRGSLGPLLVGHAAFAEYVDSVHATLENYRCDIVDLVEEGERVVARMRFHGRHCGPLLGHPASRRQVEWAGSAHFTFAGGRIVDLWVLGDLHGLAAQLAAAAIEGASDPFAPSPQ